MASKMAQSIVRDVLLAIGSRANDADVRVALHNVDAGLSELREVLLDCDSNLSAYGHGRPLTKAEAVSLSQRARALYSKLEIK
jgi:predicted nuclease with RNAse H fold